MHCKIFCTHSVLAHSVTFFRLCLIRESGFSVYTWFFYTLIAVVASDNRKQHKIKIDLRRKQFLYAVKRGYYCIMLHWTQTMNIDNDIVNSYRIQGPLSVTRNRRNIYHFKNLNQLNSLIRNNWWQFGSMFVSPQINYSDQFFDFKVSLIKTYD